MTNSRRLPASVRLPKNAPDDRNHIFNCKIDNWFSRDLRPTSRAGILRLLLSGNIIHRLQRHLNRVGDVWTNGVKNLREIPRHKSAVHVVSGMCASMFSECFVEPAFEASLAVRVSAIKETRGHRLVHRKQVKMRTYR